MKLLVVGAEGSIGKKRKALLEEMGHKVTGIDVGSKVLMGVNTASQYDAVFLCTPPNTLVEMAKDCCHAGVPFFVEKPAAANFREFLPLVSLAEKKNILNMVACNIRFTTEYKAIQDALPNIGKPLYVNAECGYFLPFWRPGEYRTYYSCYRMAGGGVLMDSIHELDYIFELFGMPDKFKAVMAKVDRSGELKDLDCEDSVTFLAIYNGGPVITVHLDYLQRAYKRTFCAVGTKGRIDQIFNVQGSTAMYKAEMGHFLHCVKNNIETVNPVDRWSKVLEFVDKIRSTVPPEDAEESK